MVDGWFKIPGVQNGPRTLNEQMLGLKPAQEEAYGKSVLDLGCAEGLIAIEFARAGASVVCGIEYNPDLVKTANEEFIKASEHDGKFLPASCIHMDITELIANGVQTQFDIVLALAVLHKLTDPAAGARFCADNAKSLIVIRLPIGSTGIIRGKHNQNMRCDVREIFKEKGFVRERKELGPRGEWVQYWRRVK
ncbi:MAG: class I SAM-dependent methyltransferase [Gallionella sp.]|jgi:predicted RNA methylase